MARAVQDFQEEGSWFALDYRWGALSCTCLGALLAAVKAWEFIVARSIMGVAGAFMMDNSSIIVADAFSCRGLGHALGINTVIAAASSTLGAVKPDHEVPGV